MSSSVVVLDTWVSMFGMRVRIALAEKGVKYEYRVEDLSNKSPLLLQMNPVHKKIPVLIHNGRPVCESLVILHYIDEAWAEGGVPRLLPSDPHARAHARFWADYADKKLYTTGCRTWADPSEDADNEFLEVLKVLEMELAHKPFFAGTEFGFLDIALIGYATWFKASETYGHLSVEDQCPTLMAWVRRCLLRKSVSESLATDQEVLDFVASLRARRGLH